MIRRFIESGRGSLLTDNTLSKQDYDYVRNQLKDELKGKYIIDTKYDEEIGLLLEADEGYSIDSREL